MPKNEGQQRSLEDMARELADAWSVQYNCDDDECGCRDAVEDYGVRMALDRLYKAHYRRGGIYG